MSNEYIILSGGFDPIHSGHINLINKASKIADVIVIVNNDNFLTNKKGYVFMNSNERLDVISSIKGVSEVFLSIDNDHTVNKSIDHLAKLNKNIKYFGNGGDRKNITDIPEFDMCKKHGIELIFDLGGAKSQSSSSLTTNVYEQLLKKDHDESIVTKPWGYYRNFCSENEYLIKKIVIDPGEELSEQMHNHRDEHWLIVEGEVTVIVNDKKYIKKVNEYIFINKKNKHKVINLSNATAIIIEIQTGIILSEGDIVRYSDKYDRA